MNVSSSGGSRRPIGWVALSVAVVAATPRAAEAQTAPIPLSTPDFAAGPAVEVTRDVVYGHIDGMATVYHVSRPAQPNDPPTLLVHGTSDTVVPIDENSRRLLPMPEDAGMEAELVEVRAGHELFTGEDKERADRAVAEWFMAHLAPGAPAPTSPQPTPCSTSSASSTTQAPMRTTGAPMSDTATGPFTVTLTPATAREGFGRMVIEKEFDGDLEGTSTGEMLTWRDESSGLASYVAVEKITGTLDGRSGSFVVTHRGHMGPDRQELEVIVIEGSGTGELEGLSGSMVLNNVDGEHDYVFEYGISGDLEGR